MSQRDHASYVLTTLEQRRMGKKGFYTEFTLQNDWRAELQPYINKTCLVTSKRITTMFLAVRAVQSRLPPFSTTDEKSKISLVSL